MAEERRTVGGVDTRGCAPANRGVDTWERRDRRATKSSSLKPILHEPLIGTQQKKAAEVTGPPVKETEKLALSPTGSHYLLSLSLWPSSKHTAPRGVKHGPHLLPELDDRRGGVLRGHIQGAIGPLELHTVFYSRAPGKEAREKPLISIWGEIAGEGK